MASQLPLESGFPQYSMSWEVLATSPAFSRPHIDAGRFHTWIRMIFGSKLWIVLDEKPPSCLLTEMALDQYKWKFFLLEEGDTL